jgi:hypothetical protein
MVAQAPVPKDVAFLSKPDNELFLISPSLMYFYFSTVYKINAFDLISLPEDQFPLFIVKALSVSVDGWDPFG